MGNVSSQCVLWKNVNVRQEYLMLNPHFPLNQNHQSLSKIYHFIQCKYKKSVIISYHGCNHNHQTSIKEMAAILIKKASSSIK